MKERGSHVTTLHYRDDYKGIKLLPGGKSQRGMLIMGPQATPFLPLERKKKPNVSAAGDYIFNFGYELRP